MVLLLAGCNLNSGGGSVTTAQATKAMQAIVGSVYLVMANSSFWTAPGGAPKVAYSASGVTMSGTVQPVSSIASFTITLSGYADAATGYTVSGSFTFYSRITATATTGTITVNDMSMSGGPVSSASGNISFSGPGLVEHVRCLDFFGNCSLQRDFLRCWCTLDGRH